MLQARVDLRCKASSLKNNLQLLVQQARGQRLIPMIKANAYGHGAVWTAKTLLSSSDRAAIEALGVATIREGMALRETPASALSACRIIVFSGGVHWTEEKAQLCRQFQLEPVIASLPDWEQFKKRDIHAIPYHLKFNTGMNRLGIDYQLGESLAQEIQALPAKLHPLSVMSHLACGESPEHAVSKKQLRSFQALEEQFRPRFPNVPLHLANSAALWKFKDWKLGHLTQIVRPGLSLYGIPPYPSASRKGLQPVLELYSPVIQIHELGSGESVGYGARFRAKHKTRVAVLPAGYADGLHRALSNRGEIWLKGKQRIIGTVSMDLLTATCPNSIRPGDRAELWGPHISPWKQAAAAGTVPYELLTSLSERVKRTYV